MYQVAIHKWPQRAVQTGNVFHVSQNYKVVQESERTVEGISAEVEAGKATIWHERGRPSV